MAKLNKIYESIKKYIKENKWFLLTLVLIIFLFNFELPYVVEVPGGFIDLEKRVEVENGYDSDGKFGMAYVSAIRGNIPFLLASFLNDNWDIVKKDDYTYDNETFEMANKRERIYLYESIDNAVINAYKMANKDYEIKGQSIYITYLNSTDTELKLLDIIKKINGYEINCLDDIKLIVDKSSVGDYVNVEVLRDDKLITVKTLVFDVNGVNKIGVGISVDYDIETEPNVNVTSSKNESGPSGGLMTSLEIYNKLVSEDITKGKKIIGTGTIDEEGNVGEIGGVKYKLIGAVKKHADVFLCPKENYDEAVELVKNKNYNIKVIGVSTFAEALEELKNI